MERIVVKTGLVTVLRTLSLASDFVLAGDQQGRILLLNIHSGEVFKVLPVGKGAVLELVVI